MQLRQQWNAVDKLVDQVVDVHHTGFNKSLQNYSQILKLFTESRLHLSALRRSLETAQMRLQPRPDQLLSLYRRYLMLGDMLRLLDDVTVAVGVPEKVRQLGHDKVCICYLLCIAVLITDSFYDSTSSSPPSVLTKCCTM